MAATAIGLDVGTNAVRAVEIELSDPPLLRRMGQVALPVGAVVEGEVADVAAVSMALKRLWDEAGFKSRAVRVGMSSARMIVRTVEMPRLSHEELMSTIRLQLDDYVPLPADDTVFDIRELDGPSDSAQTMQLLLAATHRDAVEPLVMALHDAKLNVTAIDVIPAALALALTRGEPAEDGSVDIVLSIGAGTLVVVAAGGGEPLFSRTIASSCGRLMTDRIATELAIGELDAERYKRLGATEDPTSAIAVLAAQPSVEELIEEVRVSLAFYAGQPGARRVRQLLLTGGGSLLPGLTSAFADHLGYEVEPANPFVDLRLGQTGFEDCDLPFLAPYMAAAIGVALGAARPKGRRIDLTPVSKRVGQSMPARRMLKVAGAVVLVGAAGVLYIQGRSALANQQDKLSAATAQLADLQTRIEARTVVPGTEASAGRAASPADIAASIASTNIDWLAVEHAVDEDSAPLGVVTSSFQGTLDAAGGAATAAAAGPARPGKLTFSATAPDLIAVADWLDIIATDARFADAWAGGFTMTAQPDGSTPVQFTMTMSITDKNLVASSSTPEVKP
ncbi:MAG: type IV pilus assembly protein PilM [Ilumatobacteraceae bacterium]